MTEARCLPDGVAPYAKTPVFTCETVPSKLVTHHNIKAESWELLSVAAGEVKYFTEESDTALAVISAGETFIILPEEVHYVQLSLDARFFVEFHKKP